MAAVKHDGDALEFASEDLQREKEILMVAVKQNGNALEFASEEIVMAAVKQNGW